MILLSRVLRFFLSHTFRYWEFLGIHITPNHFYSPIPSLKGLDYKVFYNYLDISNTFSYFLPEKHHIMSFWIRRK